MSATTANMKRNDTSPALLWRVPFDINSIGSTVVFSMRSGSNVVVNRGPALFHDARTLRYDWELADTADIGCFDAEFEVTYSDGSVETFPNKGYITVKIEEDIG